MIETCLLQRDVLLVDLFAQSLWPAIFLTDQKSFPDTWFPYSYNSKCVQQWKRRQASLFPKVKLEWLLEMRRAHKSLSTLGRKRSENARHPCRGRGERGGTKEVDGDWGWLSLFFLPWLLQRCVVIVLWLRNCRVTYWREILIRRKYTSSYIELRL